MFQEPIDLCTKELVYKIPYQQRCSYVEVHCASKGDFMNYFNFYFCAAEENVLLTVIACVFPSLI